MRYVAAYLLCALGGKEPTAASIKDVLSSVGIDCDDERLNKVISELSGKSINEVIEAGKSKLASVPTGGVAAAGGGAAPAAGEAKEEKKEEEKKKEESEEESDDDMGFGLFD